MENFDGFVPKLAVVGVGGGGCNLANRLHTKGIKSAKIIAANTDIKHLNIISADKKILLGKEITRGLGAGGYPEVGMKAAEASKDEIIEAISGHDLVFVCLGAGGGSGGGGGPVIAKLAKEQGALVVAFVTYPFSLERVRKQKADWTIQELSKHVDSLIIIENDRILSYAPNLPLDRAFDLIDSIAANAIKGISDTILYPSLINLDFADLRSVLGNTGTAVISIGYGSGNDKVERAIKSTLSHPLLDVDYEGAKSALIHVSGSSNLSIEEATKIGAGVTNNVDANANVIFGARTNDDPNAKEEIMVMSIITGVKPKFLSADYKPLAARETNAKSDFISGLELL